MSSSDSSEDEDLSRFNDVVDTSFLTSFNKNVNNLPQEPKLHSLRHLDTSSHYNDVKVPEKLQNQIGAKISVILNKSIEYIDVCDDNPTVENKIEGGIKLFSDSEGLLSCEEAYDNYTENHNIESKKLKQKSRKRQIDHDLEILSENEKLDSVAVSGQYVLAKEETKYWKSRRKEKLYKYKAKGKNKVLIAVN